MTHHLYSESMDSEDHSHLPPSFDPISPDTANVDSFEDNLWATYNRYASSDDQVDSSFPTPGYLHGVHNDSTIMSPDAFGTFINSPYTPPTTDITPQTPISSASSSLPTPLPSRPIIRRKSRSSSSPASDEQDTTQHGEGEEEEAGASIGKKHTQKRERNRLSARKCRQRSKSKLSNLEEQADEMREHHESLMEEIKDLQYELIATQVACMEQIRCGCADVRLAMVGQQSTTARCEMHNTVNGPAEGEGWSS